MHAMSLLEKVIATQRLHRPSDPSSSPGAGRRCAAPWRQARTDPPRSSPRRSSRCQTPHQGRGPTAGQSAPASGTRQCLWRLGEDGPGRRRASGDPRRLGGQRAGAQAAHPQGGGAGQGTSDFDLRRSASDAPLQQPQDPPAISPAIANRAARGLSPHRGRRCGIPRADSACRTHFRNVSLVHPIFSAIDPIAAHCESCAD